MLQLSEALQVLKDVAEAKVRDLDMWQISLACNVEQQKAEDLPDGKLTQSQQVKTGVWQRQLADGHRCECGLEVGSAIRECSSLGCSVVCFDDHQL